MFTFLNKFQFNIRRLEAFEPKVIQTLVTPIKKLIGEQA
jgi:hypothetical protein